MVKTYEEALTKIADCEKASGEKREGAINVNEIVTEKKDIFTTADYNGAVALIDDMISETTPAAGAAVEPVPPVVENKPVKPQPSEEQKKKADEGVKRFVAELGKDLEKARGDLGKATAKVAVEKKKENATPKAPHLELGKLVGNIESEMGKKIEKASKPKPKKKSEMQDVLSGLSLADQLNALENITIRLRQSDLTQDQIEMLKEDIQSLYSKVNSQKPGMQESGFEKRLIELRNQRLIEVMGILGIKSA